MPIKCFDLHGSDSLLAHLASVWLLDSHLAFLWASCLASHLDSLFTFGFISSFTSGFSFGFTFWLHFYASIELYLTKLADCVHDARSHCPDTATGECTADKRCLSLKQCLLNIVHPNRVCFSIYKENFIKS